MTHTQKILAIVLFGIVYGLAAWLVFREDHESRVNYHACPLCEK